MRTKLPDKLAQKIPPETWEIFKKFAQNGYEIYLVGGGVKSLFKNEIPIDCDFTTNATPKIIQSLIPDSFYDNVFGTVGISLKTKRRVELYEITTYRSEWGYTDRRRPDQVKWGTKLEEDLKRRDFTMNAVVIGPTYARQSRVSVGKPTLEMIDLFGGQKDFHHKIIRAVGNPEERFAEDALRMMRAIRFASQYGFEIEKKTFAAIQKNASLINQISKERVRDELLKILSSRFPADGYLLLRNSNLSRHILPELDKAFGVVQKSPGRHHLDDVGTHSVKSLKASRTKDALVNLAILLHDVGKPVVVSKDKKGTITFYNHEVVGASIAKNIGRRLRLSKKDSDRLFILVRWHQFSVDERQTDSAIRRFIRNIGEENLTDMLELRRADRLGGGARETSWRLEAFKKKLVEVQKQPFTVADLKINGNDVMKTLKIHPGPLVGKILSALFEEVVTNKTKNQKNLLLKRIKAISTSSFFPPA